MASAVKTFDYLRLLPEYEDEIMDAVRRVLRSGHLILGPETEAFESEFASYVGAAFCVGVNSGTTAVHIALKSLGIGPGDEVITVANTCVPTIAGIRLCGADVRFVDVRDDDLMMDVSQVPQAMTKRTRCVLPVHLWGQAADLDSIEAVCRKAGLLLVEDCAQAHGTRSLGRHVGTIGHCGCFSFYPTKNLGAYGEAGAVVTNDPGLARILREVRMYGYDGSGVSVREGMNARISEMQAAILRVKLHWLPVALKRRRRIAQMYDEGLSAGAVKLPVRQPGVERSLHQYVVRCARRDDLVAVLKENEVGYGIHYPVPVHEMPAYQEMAAESGPLPVTEKACREIVSLPIHDALSDDEVEHVIDVVNRLEDR